MLSARFVIELAKQRPKLRLARARVNAWWQEKLGIKKFIAGCASEAVSQRRGGGLLVRASALAVAPGGSSFARIDFSGSSRGA